MICNKCYRQIPNGSEFCYHCGEKIIVDVFDDINKKQTPVIHEYKNIVMHKITHSKETTTKSKIKTLVSRIFQKKNIALIVVSALLLMSLINNVILSIDVYDYKNLYNISLSNAEKYQNQVSDLEWEISGLENDLYFYNKYVVFVSDDGTNIYHKVDCYKFDTSYFWAFNIDAAQDKGYKPCSWCCG